MAAERKPVELNQELNGRPGSVSLATMTDLDKFSEKEFRQSGANSSIFPLADTTPDRNNSSHQQPVAEPGHHMSHSKLCDNGYIHTRSSGERSYKSMQSNVESRSCYIGYNQYVNRCMVGSDGYTGIRSNFSVQGSTVASKPRYSTSIKSSDYADTRVILNSSFQPMPFSSFSNYSNQNQHSKSSNKVPQLGCDLRSSVFFKDSSSPRSFSSSSNQEQGLFFNGPSSYRENGQTGVGYDGLRMVEKSIRNSSYEAQRETSRGPRSRGIQISSDEKEQLGPRVRRDRYHRSDFQIVHDNANFFIIKSYSEDDIHKSIKFDVWSSTPNGNRKLNEAFHDAESRCSEKGTRCPIFLFFSVNGSGQFLGLAEMIGPVNFEKNMDFWQQDKWSGFFPIRWHIIKDIPNNRLRHIILENNDNKPVTYTRDTQEVQLKQGLEMLCIFKNFSSITSILDDYKFYEEQDKFLQIRKSSKKESQEYENYRADILERNIGVGPRKDEHASMRTRNVPDSYTYLLKLAGNLSLNQKNSAGNNLRRV